MEIRKTTLLTETLFGETVAEAQMESAIPLPQGKTLERVLSAECEASLREIACRDGAVVVTGVMTLRPTVESAERMPYAFEAAAEFSHTIRMDGVTPEMTARVTPEIPACSLRREDGGLRMQATVQLRTTVFRSEQVACVTGLEDAPEAELMTAGVTLKRRTLLGAHSLRLNETIDAPRGMTVLRANGTPLVNGLVKGADGMIPQGELKLCVLFGTADGGIKKEEYSVPFSDVIGCEPGENAFAAASLTSLSVTVEEDGAATVDAALSIGVYGSSSDTRRILTDAYDAAQSFTCETTHAQALNYEGAWSQTVQMNETIPVPPHMRDASLPLYAALRPAVTRAAVENGKGVIEGVLAVTVVYRDDDGMKQSFPQELPMLFETEARGTLLIPRIRAYDARLSGSGRSVSLSVTVSIDAEWYRETGFDCVPELGPGTPPETDARMLVWFADPDETLFSIGKRFGVPTARVRACNPSLTEPIAEGTPVILIRTAQ
ncbi:MAG: DUF3794 domain-containing protein [Clostridia bacterium]|nr:DUF3794 domain-containing protein [Clostridia bacterium]